MSRFNLILAIATASLLAIAGCNTEKITTDAADAIVQDTASVISIAKEKATGAVSGFTSLESVVARTKAAVAAGDFPTAQAEIAKFEGFWAIVKDDVKAKSSRTYDAIETNVSSAEAAIESADQPKAMNSLKALDDAVAIAAKP